MSSRWYFSDNTSARLACNKSRLTGQTIDESLRVDRTVLRDVVMNLA
jgi:hypothetical protein